MIVGDRNMMKASLTRGVLQIQLNLIQLYTSNLNSIATQAALISGFEFTGIAETIYPHRQTSGVYLQEKLAYFYYGFIVFGIVCGLFAVSQATIVTIYGPGTALSGDTPEAMTNAVSNMRKQQDFIFQLCGVSVTCLFIACVCMEWARRPKGVAALITFIYIIVYYFMYTEGRKAYILFTSIKEGVGGYESELQQQQQSSSSSSASPQKSDNRNKQSSNEQTPNSSSSKKVTIDEANRTRARGEIWMRQSLSRGGELELCYGVLERGKLDIYRSEAEYKKLAEPITKQPIPLWRYRLELDTRKFGLNQTSISKSLRSATTGQEEFSLTTLMSSEYDLKLAVAKFRFALCPKVISELAPLPIYEFMASDEECFVLWTKAFQKVFSGYEGVTIDPSLETTMKSGTNIELAVSAASKGA